MADRVARADLAAIVGDVSVDVTDAVSVPPLLTVTCWSAGR